MIRKLCQSTVRLSLRQHRATPISSCTPAIQQQTRSYLGDAGEMQPRQIDDEVAKREQELWNKAQPKYDAIMERHLRLPTVDNNNDMTDMEKKETRELDIRKKRLIYRSKQRGWLEVDLLLGTWSDLSTSTSSIASSPALYLLAGNNQGDGYIFRMDVNQITPVMHLKGGHRGCIRDFCWSSNRLITGGEDARLCEWDLTGSSSSVSNSNVGGTSGWNRSHNDSAGGGPVSGRSAVKGISKDGKKKKFGSPY